MLYSLPKPSDEKAFENLCCDIMKTKFPLGFTVYGRNGQKQNGIDMQLNELDFDKSYQIIIKINKD